MSKKSEFAEGVRNSIPIAIGYFSVSFSFGIMVAAVGLTPSIAGLMSITNVTSAGQFAGLTLISNGTTYMEIILTQLIINLRYALMSLSLSQKLSSRLPVWKRMVMAFANTDEIFAVASARKGEVSFAYMEGLELLPVLFWTLGSVVGAVANNLLPIALQSALGVALYAMFVAIILPPAREKTGVALVVVLAILISCGLHFIPVFSGISSGFSIIISTVLAAGIGSVIFPIREEE